MPLSPLEIVHRDCTQKLNAEPFFFDIHCFQLLEADVDSQLEAALAGTYPKNGHCGAAVAVLAPVLTGEVKRQSAAGPFVTGRMTFRAFEYPVINRETGGTGKRIYQLATALGQIMDKFHLIMTAGPLYPATQFYTPDRSFLPVLAYDVNFEFLFPMARISKVATPTFNPATGIGQAPQTMTISCATPGATIFYTEDGSFPAPADVYTTDPNTGVVRPSTAIQYAGPFELNTSTLRTAAYMLDQSQFGSDVNTGFWNISLLGGEGSQDIIGIDNSGGILIT